MDQSILKTVTSFFSQYPERQYPRGQILIFNGEESDYIYFIESGRVSQYDISYRGEEVTVNMYQHPAFFPVAHAMESVENEFFYKCDVDTVVRRAPKAEVQTFLRKNPEVVYDLLNRVYRGVDTILKRMVHLMAGSAADRVIYELISECKRFGHENENSSYTLSMSEVQLASQSGLTRETISRELKKLKMVGLLSVGKNGVTIFDLQKLKSYLNQ